MNEKLNIFSIIKHKINSLSHFSKSIIILSSGSLISQGLIVLISPILTRLYTPEAFGILALFTSLSAIFGSLFTGKYEQAIFLPKKDSQVFNLIHFIIVLSLLLSFGLFVFLTFTYNEIGFYFRLRPHIRTVILLIPIMTFSIGLYSCMQLWFQRKEAYSTSSLNSIFQSLFVVFTNILFAFIGITLLGLVFGYMISIIFSTILLIIIFKKKKYIQSIKYSFSFQNSLKAAIEYKRFPQFILWAELLVTLTQQLVPVILTALYSPVIVGLFSFSNRLLRIPSILLAGSVWGVYRNEAVKIRNDNQSIFPIYKKTLKKLTLLGIAPFIVILFFGPQIFSVIFGKEWIISGVYSQIMSIFLYTELISFPLSSTFIICNKQRTFLFLQLMSISLCISGIVLGKYIGDDTLSIILYSIFGIISNLTSIVLSYKTASND